MQDDRFFKELIDNLTEGIYFLDRARRITYWNRGAERLTGYPAEEVLGRYCAEGLLQHMDPNGWLLCNDGCPMEATMHDGRERATEVFLHHKKGHRVPAVPGLEVTVSVGVTGARSDDTVASLVARADARMYEAKKRARNLVVDDADATS